MSRDFWLALISVALAIGITTAMDATGYNVFSALPLLPLTLLFWFLAKLSRREIGLTPGTAPGYLWGLQTHIFGPEVGLLAIALNAIFLAVLWRWYTAKARATG